MTKSTKTPKHLGQTGLLAGLALTLMSACGSDSAPAEVYRAPKPRPEFEAPRNAIIFLVDTLRADHLGCYGYARHTSPRIDTFAEQSQLFENCIAQSTWTKPASASVLTGLYPSLHGMLSESAVLPQSVKNIAGLLADSELTSGAFVGNQYVFRTQGEMLRDFDYHKGFSSKAAPSYARAEVIVDAALQWIEERGEERFVAYIHTVDPHGPYGGTPPFDEKFIEPGASSLGGRFVIESDRETLANLGEADRQRMIDLYDGDVAYTDHQFGVLLDGLTRLERDKDTMVIFVADHGEEFREHGSWQHNPFMHPEVLNVPLIVRLPTNARSFFQGRRVDYCGQVDVVPTVLDALGFWPKQGLSGRSLLVDPGSAPLPPIFSEIEGGTSIKALVSKDFKYIRSWSPSTQETLYDLRNDPDERKNIAKRQPELLAQHRKLMDDFVATSASGYSILFQNEGEEWATVEVGLESDQPFDRVKLIFADTKARHGAERDGPPVMSSKDGSFTAHVTLHVRPRDGDGISFVLGPESKRASLQIKVDDKPVSTQMIQMGPNARHPEQLPIEFNLSQAASLSMPLPQARGRLEGQTQRILIWSNMGPETNQVPITSEERSALEAIGYAGAEDEESEE